MNTELEKISQELDALHAQRTKYIKLLDEAEESGDEVLLEEHLKACKELTVSLRELTDKLLNWHPQTHEND